MSRALSSWWKNASWHGSKCSWGKMSSNAQRPWVSVVIPVYNERGTIEEILSRVQAVDVEKEIVIIDDGSTDGTRAILDQISQSTQLNPPVFILPTTGHQLRTDNIRVFVQDKNQGKGAALRRGMKEANGQTILIQDADLEYDPEDYHGLLEPIKRGRADVVYGSRFLGGPHRVLYYWHSNVNWLLTLVSNMLTDLNLTDVWTCYKVFRREVVEKLELKENRFGFEPEITARIARNKDWRVYEVPISYYGRTYAEGKKITWKDAFPGLWSTIRYSLFK
jgi:glycosyltransferase involved in cell wall biosynthesis